MSTVNFEVHGLREMEKALKDLRVEMGGKEGNIVATSLRNAGKDTILFSMISQAARHQKTGRLIRALKIIRHPRPSGWSELYGIGVHKTGKRPAKGEADNGLLPWYAAIVEYGGKGKSGPLKGFMREAAESNKEAFVAKFRAEAGQRIEKAAKKIGNENLRAVGSRIRNL
jgi:hypothetical protein